MKSDRRKIYVYFNIVILLGCILTGYILSVDARKYAGTDTLYAAPKLNQQEYSFTMEELELLEDELDTGSGILSYEKVENKILKNGRTELYTKVIYTNNVYFSINNVVFTEGGPWQSIHNRDNIVILSEYTAWYLFGSLDVVGKIVSINNTPCEITGIIKQEEGNRLYFAWMPIHMNGITSDNVSNLFFKDFNYNRLDSIVRLEALLDMADKKPVDYYIADLNQYGSNIQMKNWTVILGALLCLFSISALRFYHIAAYGIKNIKEKPRYSAIFAAGTVFSTLGMYFVYGKIKSLMWLTNQPFSIKSVLETILNLDTFPGKEYLSYGLWELVKINRYSNFVFILSIICMVNILFLTDKNFIEKEG